VGLIAIRRWLFRILLLIVFVVATSFVSSRIGARGNAIKINREGSGSDRIAGGAPVVGAYNIAHGRGGVVGASNRRADGKAGLMAHLKAIGAEIERQCLDIVVLNEVDFESSWSWRVNQAEVIAEAAGLPYILEQRSYDASVLFYKWEFGNAVLSRYPISEAELIEYPAFKKHETFFFGKKEGSVCKITTVDFDLRVVAVHLEVRDEATRAGSMEILKELEASRPDQRFLIMGDFNSQVVFEESERLSSAGGLDRTFPSAAPDRRIDWIFSGPSLELGEERVFGGDLSDHLGVRARVLRGVDR
jgi:endonuclease/exonuclease/phosphatase family metal-dependent hydrolase